MPDYRSDLPANYYFGGGDEATAGTPLAVAVLVLAVILVLALPRKYAFVPFLIAGLLVPLHVVLIIGSLHFNAARILILFGLLRLLIQGRRPQGALSVFDLLVVGSALCSAVMYCVLWRDFGAVVNRLGFLLTTVGGYVILRFLIRDRDDVIRAIKTMGVVAILIAPCMVYEHITSYNLFWLMGAPEITNVRDGQIRSQGPFGHAIVAGTVGSVLFPLLIGLLFLKPRPRIAWAAAAAALVMAVASHSSTPLLTFAAASLGLALWPLRKNMRLLRWSLVGLLLLVQLVMDAPIWFLMTRASGIMGGSGWHRSMLIDNFFRHFGDWWLYGTRNNPEWGWSMWDVDNAYVAAGLSGGLLSFLLFVAVIVFAFRLIGRARRQAERFPNERSLIWVLGVSMFASAVGYFGMVYFDQAVLVWYALLAMISVVPRFVPAARSAEAKREAVAQSNMDALAVARPDAAQPDPVLWIS